MLQNLTGNWLWVVMGYGDLIILFLDREAICSTDHVSDELWAPVQNRALTFHFKVFSMKLFQGNPFFLIFFFQAIFSFSLTREPFEDMNTNRIQSSR